MIISEILVQDVVDGGRIRSNKKVQISEGRTFELESAVVFLEDFCGQIMHSVTILEKLGNHAHNGPVGCQRVIPTSGLDPEVEKYYGYRKNEKFEDEANNRSHNWICVA